MEHWWNNTGRTELLRQEPTSKDILYTTNPTWTAPRTKAELRNDLLPDLWHSHKIFQLGYQTAWHYI